ncbi:ABC transporter ATP-binding protein [Cryobacterium lactosi]|uniref:ABC-type quaternary amine transporter n=1 Tax=Cryobacterium lactosi TaxID=1259202 RepID=A0A4R9BX27_9MICO|nr:ABC transporter ATP-binding protein [Cryobacterium lactosi]TFD92053.1 ABC transporter ATP-binding protein [Cryobacterium lactosi]
MTSLTIEQISKDLGGLPVLRAVSLSLEAGSRLAVVGASGSGKSTLLRLIAGFDRPDSGSVRIDDSLVSDDAVFVPAHRRGIGYVAQDGALFPHLTVAQNIHFGLRGRQRRGHEADAAAELVGLDVRLLKRYPHELSGGQQQRVALARALAPGPRILLLDEPFSALDSGLRNQTRHAVVEAVERTGTTTVLVTHDQAEALSFGQQIAVISGGRIDQAGSPIQVFQNPSSPQTADFLGDAIFVPCQVQGTIAESALGRLHVAYDHRAGGGEARALLRPTQLSLDLNPDRTNAVIVRSSFSGSTVRLDLRLTGPGAPTDSVLTFDLMTAHPDGYAVGTAVALSAAGAVGVYSLAH